MREFRFDTATRRAYLNGKPYFLRGSNITLHRFFEDPEVRAAALGRDWVRKLLVGDSQADALEQLPLLHRPGAGQVAGHRRRSRPADPERVLHLGLPQAVGHAELLIAQYSEWMRDNWNHPSVAIWDARTKRAPTSLSEIIPRVRGAGPLEPRLGERLQPARRARTIRWKTIPTCSAGWARASRWRNWST